LDFSLQSYGEKHPESFSMMFNLEVLYMKMQTFEEARKTFERVTSIAEKLYGEFHDETALCYEHLGYIYINLKNQRPYLALRRH